MTLINMATDLPIRIHCEVMEFVEMEGLVGHPISCLYEERDVP